MTADNEVEVLVAVGARDVLAGRAYFHPGSTTFQYDSSYLRLAGAYPLDPGLPLTAGSIQTAWADPTSSR